MPSDKKVLASLDIDTRALVKAAQETKQELEEIKDRQQKLVKQGKETSAEFVQNEAVLKSLNIAYREQTAAVAAQVNEDGKLLTVKKAVKDAVKEVNDSENDYMNNNKQLLALKKQLSISDDDYEKRLAKINAKIAENNTWLRENGSANANLLVTMSDYKDEVTDSFDAINIFNGGISGFVSRAQEAGGVGKLFSTSISGMTDGLKGMGKAIMSNPIGFLLSLLAPLIEKLMSMPPVTNAVEKAMAALGPIMDILSKPIEFLANTLAWLIEGFADFVSSSTEAGRAAQELEKAQAALKAEQEALAAAMSVQEEKNEKAKQDAKELMDIAKDQTKTEAERTAALQKAIQTETTNMAQRKKLADEAYNQAVRQAAMGKGLTADELEGLQKGGAAYAEKMMKVKGFTKEEIDTLQKANVERIRLNGEEKNMLQSHEAAKQKINEDALAKQEAARAKAEQAEEARRQKAEKARQDALTRQKLELDLFIQQQGTKALTMQQELALQEKIHTKKIAIINAEYAASDKSANARLQRDAALQEQDNEMAKQRAVVAVDNAAKELQAYLAANKTRLEDGKALTAKSVEEERTRLEGILQQQMAYEKIRLDNGLIAQDAYDAAITKLKADNDAANQTLEDALVQEDKDKKAANIADEYQKKRESAATEFDKQRIDEEERHTTRLADLAQQLADEKITQDQYNQLELEENKKTADEQKRINAAAFNNKLDLANQTFGSLQAILGKESAAGKAMAIAQATIDTYKSAVSAYGAMSGIPVVGPALGAVAAAAAVAAGVQNVKKITSTKSPKAEKGALFSIGGQRHSAGGTLFTGADGTKFEAEKGELIGVMNRNAARHFMAFNNAFPAGGGSTPNYFASGGIVSREVAQQGFNIDELAAKIAMANSAIPAPVVAVQDIISQGNSYVKVREGANF